MHACTCALCVEARQNSLLGVFYFLTFFFFETSSLCGPWLAQNSLCRSDWPPIQRSKSTASFPDCCWLKGCTSMPGLHLFFLSFFLRHSPSLNLEHAVWGRLFTREPWDVLTMQCWGPHEVLHKDAKDLISSSHAHTAIALLPELSFSPLWGLN